MIVVLDASGAAELVLGRPAKRHVADSLAAAEWVLTSSFFVYEVGNVFWKYTQAGHLSLEASIELARDATSLIDEYIAGCTMYEEAFSLTTHLSITVYDASYLVCARRRSATLISLDKELAAAAKSLGVTTGP